MFRSLPRSGTYRSKTYCMEKAFEFLKANKAVAFKNLHSIIRMLLDERTEYADWQIPDSLPKQQMMMRSLLNVRPPHPVDDDFLKAQICTYRKSGIARKTTAAYPELRYLGKNPCLFAYSSPCKLEKNSISLHFNPRTGISEFFSTRN